MPTPVAPFDYTALPGTDRSWLRDKVGVIHLLTRHAAESLVHIGGHLSEVRDRMPGLFKAWVNAEFAFGTTTAFKWMRVHAKFGERLRAKPLPIDPTALYLLTDRKCPPEAVDHCFALAEAGTRVTAAVARAAIRPDKPPPNEATRRAYDRRLAVEERPDRQHGDVTLDPRAVLAAFLTLVSDPDTAVVSFRRIDDTEEDPSFHQTGGTADRDRGALIPIAVTVARHGGPPVTTIDADSWEVLLLKAAGMEPTRRCAGPCGQVKGLFTGFSRKKGNHEGRCPKCKTCEQSRVRKAKKNIERRKRRMQESLPPGFDPDAWRTKQR